MKLVAVLGASLWLSLSGTSGAFTCNGNSKKAFFSSTRLHTTNTLDGKELSGDFVPLNNMLLVKKSEVVDQTEGGIFLTGKAKIQKTEGIVVNVGPGRVNQETGFHYPMAISPGDVVSYGQFAGEDVMFNDAKHTLLSDYDVMVHFKQADECSDDLTLEQADVLMDTVLIQIQKIKEEKASGGSGLLIASTAQSKKKKSSVGTVVKVGPGQYANNGVLMEMDVQPGDMVKFKDFSAAEVQIGDKDFAVVKMRDILAKF